MTSRLPLRLVGLVQVSALALVGGLVGCGSSESPANESFDVGASDAAVPGDDAKPAGDDASSTPEDAAPSDAGSADTPAPAADASAPPTPSSGCGLAKPATGLQSKTITVSGVSRHYQVFVPTGYDPSLPTRLVFVFHGLGGDGNQIRSYLSLEALAGAQALFVYPDGLVLASYGRTGWAESDLAFFDAMVAEISAAYCVDAKRIFATGHSFGGYMSNLVGCERGDVVRAIAAVSGGLSATSCKGPMAAWIAHGDADTTVPQSEGIHARDHWVTADGCATTTKPTTPAPCVAYDGCSAGHPVTWCSFAGGHYPLPSYTRQAIWDFFQPL